jgi:hypothetical protein
MGATFMRQLTTHQSEIFKTSMFNEGGRALSFDSLRTGQLYSQNVGRFTYNDSAYVHALNKTLELEQAALAIYSARTREQTTENELSSAIQERFSCHQLAYRQLVKIIFAQRGLPDSDPLSFTAITSTFAIRIGKWMPRNIQSPVLGLTSQRVEAGLVRRYTQLLKLAPIYDQEILGLLFQQSRDFSFENL